MTFIERWNVRFPIDRWWRNKYKIPFGSPAHKNQSMGDIILEYEEDKLYRQLSLTSTYKEGDWLEPRKESIDALEDAYDSLDLKDLKDVKL